MFKLKIKPNLAKQFYKKLSNIKVKMKTLNKFSFPPSIFLSTFLKSFEKYS